MTKTDSLGMGLEAARDELVRLQLTVHPLPSNHGAATIADWRASSQWACCDAIFRPFLLPLRVINRSHHLGSYVSFRQLLRTLSVVVLRGA
jgi:hypothetical protein